MAPGAARRVRSPVAWLARHTSRCGYGHRLRLSIHRCQIGPRMVERGGDQQVGLDVPSQVLDDALRRPPTRRRRSRPRQRTLASRQARVDHAYTATRTCQMSGVRAGPHRACVPANDTRFRALVPSPRNPMTFCPRWRAGRVGGCAGLAESSQMSPAAERPSTVRPHARRFPAPHVRRAALQSGAAQPGQARRA
jgi:hypothetical protein